MKLMFIIFLVVFPFSLLSNDSINVELGIPINLDDSYSPTIILKHEYCSAVRCEYGVPVWVSYNLNKDWYGDAPRWSGNFQVDSLLQKNCWIKHSDYTNSGYDRGHLVRSEERTRTEEENRQTFKTSNIIPQLSELNQQTWLKLEYYAENLAKDSLKEMYIIDGPVFSKTPIVFYKDKLAIPDSCYKIIVVLDKGKGLNDVNENTQIIAVMMPNDDPDVKKHDWTEYKTTIRHIENSTKLDFLTNLPKTLQDKLKNLASTSIKEFEPGKIKVYPNPASEYINIEGTNCFKIFDVYGREIGSYNKHYIDLVDFPTGIYMIQSKDFMTKFIKY